MSSSDVVTEAVPRTVPRVLRLLSQLSEAQFAEFLKLMRSEQPFIVTDEVGTQVSSATGLRPDAVRAIMVALSDLYQQLSEGDYAKDAQLRRAILRELVNDIRFFQTNQDLKLIVLDRLALLLAPTEPADQYAKFQRLQRGLFPTIESVEQFVDLRPVLNIPRDAVTALLPVIQLRITTVASEQRGESFVFEATTEGIARLREALDSAEEKIEVLRKSEQLGALIKSVD